MTASSDMLCFFFRCVFFSIFTRSSCIFLADLVHSVIYACCVSLLILMHDDKKIICVFFALLFCIIVSNFVKPMLSNVATMLSIIICTVVLVKSSDFK